MKLHEWKMIAWLRAQAGERIPKLPAASIAKLEIDENSIIVIHTPMMLSAQGCERLRQSVESAIKKENSSVLILPDDMRLSVLQRREGFPRNDVTISPAQVNKVLINIDHNGNATAEAAQ